MLRWSRFNAWITTLLVAIALASCDANSAQSTQSTGETNMDVATRLVAEWCDKAGTLPQDVQLTIDLTLAEAEADECKDAVKEIAQLQRLALDSEGVIDITPLQYLTNLKSLSLWRNSITDVSPLAALTNLETLDIRDNEVTDISALATLTKLKALYLEGNPIANQTCPLAEGVCRWTGKP